MLYDDFDDILARLRVRAATFNKPKKQQNRVRELEAPLEYFNTGDVLEDITTAFGATACLYGGCLTLACRLDLAFYGGNSNIQHQYWVQPSTGTYGVLQEQLPTPTQKEALANRGFKRLRTSSTSRLVPPGLHGSINRVDLTHEKEANDWLYANGYFLNPEISYINYGDAAQIADRLLVWRPPFDEHQRYSQGHLL